MMSDAIDPSALPPADGAWREIENSLNEIARLAKTDVPLSELHGVLLQRLVPALAAVGGAVWMCTPDGPLRLDAHVAGEASGFGDEEAGSAGHQQLLESVCRAGQPRLVPPRSGDDRGRNPTPFLLVLCPLQLDGVTAAVVEVFQRPEADPELQAGYLRVVTAACELVGDGYRDRRLREFTAREAYGRQLREFSDAVHRVLDLEATADTVANDGRRLIGCDRVGVVLRRGTRWPVAAISGVDLVERRSSVVRRLEALVRLVVQSQTPLWLADNAGDLSPELAAAVEAYRDESHVRALAIVPLRAPAGDGESPAAVLGAVVVERFHAATLDELRERVEAMVATAAPALRNALEYARIPLGSLSRLVGRARWFTSLERLPRTVAALVLAAAAVAALCLVPAEFTIPARGELQPQRRFHVFAPRDGVVVALPKGQGESVRRGEPLAVLTDPQLESEFTDVTARRRTTEEQLAAVRAARLRNDPAAVNARDRYDLTAQEEQLKQRLQGLEQQYQILAGQRQALEVRSPTDGQVLTWDIERLLAARPVQRGDRLLTVADLEGPWELELRIDDDQAGHVFAAGPRQSEPLRVSFHVATEPGVSHAGRLQAIGTATEVDDAGRPMVWATVALDDTLAQPRPGATVVAKIHCGRRAIGYVWLRPLFEVLQQRWFFE